MNITISLALLGALSVASERVVEIVKGIWPWLGTEKKDDQKVESRRQAAILVVAIVAGGLLAVLAEMIPGVVKVDGDLTDKAWTALALGFLSAGGSGLWNSIQVPLNKLKDTIAKPAS